MRSQAKSALPSIRARVIKYEDPQSKLIPNDQQWHEIVMKNKTDYESEKARVKAERL